MSLRPYFVFLSNDGLVQIFYIAFLHISSNQISWNWHCIGETYILYNQQTKGNKRELIQLGAPIFGHIKEESTGKDEDSKNSFPPKHICFSSTRFNLSEAYISWKLCNWKILCTGHIEPIPTLLQEVIDHLIQWHLISENRKPNSCIINFFDEVDWFSYFILIISLHSLWFL